ncbi:HAD family hydrolase [bacterium]|nr:HAD family hydrolase [bacterium]
MRKAVFLDRDGTLIDNGGYLATPDGVQFYEGVEKALLDWEKAEYLRIVITNQSGVARGFHTSRDVEAIHHRMSEILSRSNASIDAYYFCPHHPDFDKNSACRKPAPGMFHQAIEEWSIDPSLSWAVGDTPRDLLAPYSLGMKTALVRTGQGERIAPEILPPFTEIFEGFVSLTERLLL